MTKILRMVSLGATAAAFAITATPAAAQSASAQANVTINKPLTLTKTGDLAFGTILVTGSGTFSTTVSVSTAGVRSTCDTTYVTCSGTATAPVYNVSGNKQRVVQLTIPDTVVLSTTVPVGQTADTITMGVIPPNALKQITLTNSGAPGNNFGVGGSLTITDSTVDGTYSGSFNVTANYQ